MPTSLWAASAIDTAQIIEPEAASAMRDQISAVYNQPHGVCVTANPYASKTCQQILSQGGSAADAAIAAAFVLGLVEPQSSGLGGGGYALYHRGAETAAYDGRETAPNSAKSKRFLDTQDKPLSFKEATASALSIGVPGMPALMHKLHQEHGLLDWEALFKPAIGLASEGFIVSSRLSTLVQTTPELSSTQAKNYFFPSGQPLQTGQLLKNQAYADTLKQLSTSPSSFYQGAIARALQEKLSQIGSDISLSDLSNYRVITSPALCRQRFGLLLCVMPPSTSGGIALLQITASIDPSIDLTTATGLTELTNAQALSFADRGLWVGDPAFFDVPVDLLMSQAYLESRAKLASQTFALSQQAIQSGLKPLSAEPQVDTPNTTHISVIDAQGEAISMTLSIEAAFGSKFWASELGFLFNNELTDFDFNPTSAIGSAANRVEGSKRPRSSMTPVIALDSGGAVQGVVGSPGGSRIIGFVTSVLVRLSQGESVNHAVSAPHVLRRFSSTEVEPTLAAHLLSDLKNQGHQVKIDSMASGLAVIWRSPQTTPSSPVTYDAAADPRREGLALGIQEKP